MTIQINNCKILASLLAGCVLFAGIGMIGANCIAECADDDKYFAFGSIS